MDRATGALLFITLGFIIAQLVKVKNELKIIIELLGG